MTEFILTKQELGKIIRNKDSDYWHDAMSKVLPAAGINTEKRVAGFLAQAAVESADFNTLEENLNYSESALNRVFGRYFKSRNAAEYARNPEKIANYVYMDEHRSKRGRLGNVKDGDGWLFRGRGLKQLTGRSNYERFAADHNMTAEEAVAFIETREGALTSAVWFWNKANCNSYADRGDIVGLSKAINGGTNGLSQRKSKWNTALRVINPSNTSTVTESDTTSKKKGSPKKKDSTKAITAGRTDIQLGVGADNNQVKIMQLFLGISADGRFGPQTQRAVKKFQRNNGLVADGIAGPNTLKKIYNK